MPDGFLVVSPDEVDDADVVERGGDAVLVLYRLGDGEAVLVIL